jgi:hypothetical protein
MAPLQRDYTALYPKGYHLQVSYFSDFLHIQHVYFILPKGRKEAQNGREMTREFLLPDGSGILLD